MAIHSDVFISYRRVDVDFAKQIDEALKATGREVWVDWEDIPPGVEGFTDEIQQGIEGADAVLAILSPSYLESDYCIMELREALRLKKRVIPLVLKKFEPSPAPEGIGHINWIYFVPHAGQENTFEESFPKIIQALEADNDHTRTHTRILMRAVEWDKGKKNPSYLLKGQELSSAETWQVAAHAKNPPPSELQSQYILTSREQQAKQQRQIMIMIAAFLVLAGVAAIIAAFQAVEAKRQEGIAILALADAETQEALALTARADAVDQAEIAQTAHADAESQAVIALTARADAVDQAEIALTARADAVDQAEIAQTAQSNAEEQRGIAVLAQSQAERQAIEAHSLALSASALSAGNENIAVALALEAVGIENPPREVVYNLYNVAYQAGIRNRFSYLDSSIAENLNFFNNPALSPDGQSILIRNSLIDIETGQVIRVFEDAPNLVLSSAFSPDGTKLVLAGDIDPFTPEENLNDSIINANYLGVWETSTGRLLQRFNIDEGVSYVQVSTDGRRLASFSANNHFSIWDMETGRKIGDYQGYERAVLNADLRLMAHQKSVQQFADGSYFYTIEVRNISNDLEVFTISFPTFASSITIEFDNTSTQLAVITDSYLSLVDMNTAYMYSLAGHSARITSVDFSESQIVTAGEDQQVNIWNRSNGELLQTFNGHDISVVFAEFRNTNQVVSLDLSGNVFLWDLQAGDLAEARPNEFNASYSGNLYYNDDKSQAIYLSFDEAGTVSTLILVDINNQSEIKRFPIEMAWISSAIFLPDNQDILIVRYRGIYDAELFKLNIATGEITSIYEGEALSFDLSPDAQTILIADYGYTDYTKSRLVSMNFATLQENYALSVIPDTAYFLDDGETFIATEYESNAAWTVSYRLRQVQTGELIRTITTDAPPIGSFVLTEDNRYLITSAFIFNEDNIETISGIRLRYGTNFDYVRLWDFETGALIRDYDTFGGALNLAPDGKSFTVTDFWGIREWRLDSLEELITWTCANRYIPEFTPEQRERFDIRSESSLCSTLGQ